MDAAARTRHAYPHVCKGLGNAMHTYYARKHSQNAHKSHFFHSWRPNHAACAQSDRGKKGQGWPNSPTEVGNFVCVRPPARPRCFVHADLCKRRGQWSGKRHASGHTRVRGGLSEHHAPRRVAGSLTLRVEPHVLPHLPANGTCVSGSATLSPARFQPGSARSSRRACTRDDRDRQWAIRAGTHILNVDLENPQSGG